jgi:mono/diheme cytochrome c family protein
MSKCQTKTILLVLGIFLFTIGRADEGEQLFKTTCAACHTIGKGRLVGPDLLNIAEKRSQEWLISFIKSSTAVIKSGDPDAVAIFKEYNSLLMPDNNYSDAQVVSILDYIKAGGSSTGGQENTVTVDILSETTSENVSIGLQLFTGTQRLENGGAACTSCHKVRDERIFSSGTLAKDLSESFDIMGSAGISAIINSPPFPVMQVAYNKNPLTEEEVINLTAYLKSVSKERIYQRPTDFSMLFAILSISAFIMILMTTIILYFRRKKFPVNREILDRPSKVIN